MKYIIIFILLFILKSFGTHGYSQSKTIDNWADNKEGLREFCFYPTTLRMINFSKEKSFNDMVKDIHKLKIILTDNKKPLEGKEITLLKEGIRSENYKDMIQVRRGKESFSIFIREKNEKPVGFAGIVHSEDGLILIDLEGYISPAVIQQLIEGKINLGAISQLYDLTRPDKKEQKQPQKK